MERKWYIRPSCTATASDSLAAFFECRTCMRERGGKFVYYNIIIMFEIIEISSTNISLQQNSWGVACSKCRNDIKCWLVEKGFLIFSRVGTDDFKSSAAIAIIRYSWYLLELKSSFTPSLGIRWKILTICFTNIWKWAVLWATINFSRCKVNEFSSGVSAYRSTAIDLQPTKSQYLSLRRETL